MVLIELSYNSSTRVLSLTSTDTGNGNAGTSVDTGTVSITVNGIPSGWAGQLDFGVRVRNNNGTVVAPYHVLTIDPTDDTIGSCIVQNSILRATLQDNKLPVQLVLTDRANSLTTASRNILVLDVADAIDSTVSVAESYLPNILGAVTSISIDNPGVMTITTLDGRSYDLDIYADDSVVYWSEVLTVWPAIPTNDNVPSVKAIDDTFVKKDGSKVLSTNDYTTEDMSKLTGIEAGAEVNVQADWNEADMASDRYIANKPTVPEAQVQSDWDVVDTSSKSFIRNKPTIPEAQVQSDWNENDVSSKAFIQNKPTVPEAQVQSDWNESDPSNMGYILNKPTLGTASARDTGVSAGNVPVLSSEGYLAESIIPPKAINTYVGTVNNQADLVMLVAQVGDWAIVDSDPVVSNQGGYMLIGDLSTVLSNWKQMFSFGGEASSVISVNNKTGVVVLTSKDLGSVQYVSEIPVPSATNVGHTIMPIAEAENYVVGHIYTCVLSNNIYYWQDNSAFSTADENKLGSIETGAEVNLIEIVQRNSVPLQITNRTVNIPVPVALNELVEDSTHRIVTDAEKSTWNAKQNALVFDSAPVSGSNKPVTSDGVYQAIYDEAQFRDDAVSQEATARQTADLNEVTNRNTAISTAISTEVTNRNTAISQAIAAEVVNRNSAISTALVSKQDNLTSQTVTLLVSDWVSNSQTVSVTGATTTNIKFVNPSLDDYDNYTRSQIRVTAEGSGTLTFYAKTLPTDDISVEVVL